MSLKTLENVPCAHSGWSPLVATNKATDCILDSHCPMWFNRPQLCQSREKASSRHLQDPYAKLTQRC